MQDVIVYFGGFQEENVFKDRDFFTSFAYVTLYFDYQHNEIAYIKH